MRLAVAGTGLIGASVALAAKERLDATVVGWDPDPAALAAAAERGAVEPVGSLAEAAEGADVVVVGAPVGVLPTAVELALEAAGPEALVTDVGSVKRGVVNANQDPRFIAGHPLAGGHAGGAAHARADLFVGAVWYLTPSETSAGVQLEQAFRFVDGLGAKPRVLPAAVHDRILATVSHLPHVLANVLVAEAAAALSEEGEPLPASGPSFRDATRVAGAPSSIWTDIYLANSDAIIERLRNAEGRLAAVRALLESGDAAAVTDWNDRAAAERELVAADSLGADGTHAVTVQVPNRPGVLAEIALTLGSEGIDLADLQLSPAADRATGTIVLWVAGSDQAGKAAELIRGLGHVVSGG